MCWQQRSSPVFQKRKEKTHDSTNTFRLVFLKEAIQKLIFHLFIYYVPESGFLSWLWNKTAVYYTSVYKTYYQIVQWKIRQLCFNLKLDSAAILDLSLNLCFAVEQCWPSNPQYLPTVLLNDLDHTAPAFGPVIWSLGRPVMKRRVSGRFILIWQIIANTLTSYLYIL